MTCETSHWNRITNQLRRLAGARFGLFLLFMSACVSPSCWASGMGSSLAFDGGGASGIGQLFIGVFLLAIAFAWVLGKEVATAVYAPLVAGALLLTPVSWFVTGKAPWERSFERFGGFLFVAWLLGVGVIWLWSARRKSPEEGPPGPD